ncbi:MAG: PEGA domain-containing protein [Rhodopirellula sp.]|nr:PEGA domain-containing protein [Rhodopirellula sp.]
MATTPISCRWPKSARTLGVAALVLLATGCVQRRMTIRSEPAGALVYIDNVEIGTTPVATNFLYYGTREIRLVKDGYETMTVLQPVPAPWYQIPPLDFFSENVAPGEIRDQRAFTYRLIPQLVIPTEDLLGRAQQLRGRATASGATLTMPPGTAPPANTLQPAPAGEVIPLPSPIPPSGPSPAASPISPQNQWAPGGTVPFSLPPAGPVR